MAPEKSLGSGEGTEEDKGQASRWQHRDSNPGAGSQSPLVLFGCFTSSEETKAQEVKSHPEIQLVSREASMPNEVYWKHRPKVSYHTDYSPFQKARSTVLFLEPEGIKPA